MACAESPNRATLPRVTMGSSDTMCSAHLLRLSQVFFLLAASS